MDGPVGYLLMCAFIVALWLALRAMLRATKRGAKSLWSAGTAKRPADGPAMPIGGAAPEKKTASGAPVFAWPELGEFEAEVAGESHCQRALKALAGAHGDEAADVRTVALLVPDDANQHDTNAVRVEIGGKLVGYLPRDDAESYRARLKGEGLGGSATASCGAVIMGGFIGRAGTRASYGVRLDIAPFDS